MLSTAALFTLATTAAASSQEATDPLAWPKATKDSRPWTRWWWLGSAVDKENLSGLLKNYRDTGFGGVEICPIYGAKGFEDRYISFLSARWMEMLAHTTSEASRLGIGVDLTTGTGWPFGGPDVTAESASSRLDRKRYDLAGGAILAERLPEGKLQCLMAVSQSGERLDLTSNVMDRRLDWTAPPGRWKLYALLQNGPVQKVKRAAPGGEGNVLDPYSIAALETYLERFDRAFAGFKGKMPRAHFHDSFEYFNASWTAGFLEEFRKRRGYDLRTQIEALFGDGTEDREARVKSDYRETISDLHLDYLSRWTKWAHEHGGLSRNQAHGVPGTLLDHYAAVDIPETESFRDVDEQWAPMWKFASSAAHLKGRRLASAESFTWLGEHFQATLADLKPAADLLFLSGINHLIYHGVPYSPSDADWPGWLFYASVNFGPNGGLWRDLPAFNAYVARCQSVLQAGKPDNDLLLYFPIHDLWHSKEGMLTQLTVPGKWMQGTPFYEAAISLWNTGYSFDHVSDRLLRSARVDGGRIKVGDGSYRAIVVPKVHHIPPATYRALIDLADAGGRILFWGGRPKDIPGFGDREKQLRQFAGLHDSTTTRDLPGQWDTILSSDDLNGLLSRWGVPREPMASFGLRCVRRVESDGNWYFVVNRSGKSFEGWIPLAGAAKSIVLLDPRFADRGGVGDLRKVKGSTEVRLSLDAGQSIIVRTFTSRMVRGRRWRYTHPAGPGYGVDGMWKLEFIEGGPALPATLNTSELRSWTQLGGDDATRFAGTARYTTEFTHRGGNAEEWSIDLGKVCESARVTLNGRVLGTLWAPPFAISAGNSLKVGRNRLKIEVTNVAANRIADLDRRGVAWKSFHEINFVNREYKPFDASSWPLRDSGLLGPVRVVPLRHSP